MQINSRDQCDNFWLVGRAEFYGVLTVDGELKMVDVNQAASVRWSKALWRNPCGCTTTMCFYPSHPVQMATGVQVLGILRP